MINFESVKEKSIRAMQEDIRHLKQQQRSLTSMLDVLIKREAPEATIEKMEEELQELSAEIVRAESRVLELENTDASEFEKDDVFELYKEGL